MAEQHVRLRLMVTATYNILIGVLVMIFLQIVSSHTIQSYTGFSQVNLNRVVELQLLVGKITNYLYLGFLLISCLQVNHIL